MTTTATTPLTTISWSTNGFTVYVSFSTRLLLVVIGWYIGDSLNEIIKTICHSHGEKEKFGQPIVYTCWVDLPIGDELFLVKLWLRTRTRGRKRKGAIVCNLANTRMLQEKCKCMWIEKKAERTAAHAQKERGSEEIKIISIRSKIKLYRLKKETKIDSESWIKFLFVGEQSPQLIHTTAQKMGRRINRICEIKYPSRVEGWLDVCGKYRSSNSPLFLDIVYTFSANLEN